MVNKGSSFSDFVRFRPHTYGRIQQSFKFKRNSKLHLNSPPINNLLTFASGYLVKFCNFYPQLSLETVFLALKLTQICCINMNISFLENWQFNRQIGFSSSTHTPRMKEYPHNLTKYVSEQNSKIPIFQLFSKLREI